MLFNSISFALFFPIVVGLYFTVFRRHQLPFILTASCIFYMAFIPAYILVLFLTITIDYAAGIYIGRDSTTNKRLALLFSISSTCLVLFAFKYFAFAITVAQQALGLFHVSTTVAPLSVILPIGLSFHTFQSLSYVIEVYYGRTAPERNFIRYATYVMFFPQLVAGPIERPQHLLHQFRDVHFFDYDRVLSGLQRMAWGFFKKLVIADRLALYVNDVYSNPRNYNGAQLSIATIFFSYQIYCDFSGYTDIAIGSARVLGFTLMENFRRPYCSSSISEFWHRWHISLSSWFKDYVYIPLGGSRVDTHARYRNLMVTFTISGLWHGANWTYILWGALNGAFLIASIATLSCRDRLFSRVNCPPTSAVRRVTKVATTFMLITIGWMLFRASSISDFLYIVSHITVGWDIHSLGTEQFLSRQFPIAILSIAALEFGQFPQTVDRLNRFLASLHPARRWSIYWASATVLLLFGVYRNTEFIYFQF